MLTPLLMVLLAGIILLVVCTPPISPHPGLDHMFRMHRLILKTSALESRIRRSLTPKRSKPRYTKARSYPMTSRIRRYALRNRYSR